MSTYTDIVRVPRLGLGASLKIYSEPNIEPVSLEEAKEWCRVSASDEDGLMEALITAARRKVERDTRLMLITQTWEQTIDRFPTGTDPLPIYVAPLASVTSVTSYAADDTSSTFSTASYFTDTSRVPGRICLKQDQVWPEDLRPHVAGVVRFVAGFGSSKASVPGSLLLAMRLLIEHWNANRGTVVLGTVSREIELAYSCLIGGEAIQYVGDEC